MHNDSRESAKAMTDGRRLVLSTSASGSRFHYAQALIKRIVIHALYDARAAIGFLAKKLEGTARRAPLSFSLLTTAALFTIVFATLAPSFHSNDDPQLAMIAAGKGACLAPDEHLIFTNVVIGHLLKALYTACPTVPWYGVYLYVVQYLAQTAILYCTVAARYTRWRLGLYLLFFVTVGIFLLNSLQFTMTASLAGQSGALLCLLALGQPAAVRERGMWRLWGCGVAMLVVSSLIRLECFYLTTLIVLPAAICWMGWPWRREVLLSAVGAGSLCLVLVEGCAAYNKAYYDRDPEWRQFLNYNDLRVKFNDYGWVSYSRETAPIFKQVAWSKNDHVMIDHWYYDDPVVYSENQLQHVLESYPWRSQRLTLEYWWTCAHTILLDRSIWGALLMLPLFLWCMTRSKRSVFAVVGSATAAVTVLISTAALMKAPPSRVYFPVLTFPLALLLLMARDQISVPWRRWLGFRLTPWIVAVFDRRNAPLSVQEFSSEVLAEKFAESVRRGGMLPVACRDCGTAHQSVSASCLGRVVVMPPLPGDRRCPNWPATWRAQAVRLLSRPTPAQVFAMLTIVGLMYGVSHQYRRSARMQIARHDLMQSLEDLHPRDDQLYVVCVPDFPYEAISPFDSLTSFVHLHQLVLGWPQRTPISQAMKQKFEIVDVARALYQRSDVFFVGDFRWCHAIYQKYIQEHYGVDVNFVVSFVGGHTYDAIGQFESRTDPALADAAKTLPDSCQDDSDSITLTVSESAQPPSFFRVARRIAFPAAAARAEKTE